MYKAINGWTKSKIIEQIYKGNDGFRSSKNGYCAYRGDKNNACAVGCFIPDEVYSDNMECLSATGLINNFTILVDRVPLPVDGLEALQLVHDRNPGGTDVREALKTWINENVED